MAAGKNAAADILREKGFVILDADVMAHGVLEAKADKIMKLFAQDARSRGLELTDSRENSTEKISAVLCFKIPKSSLYLKA